MGKKPLWGSLMTVNSHDGELSSDTILSPHTLEMLSCTQLRRGALAEGSCTSQQFSSACPTDPKAEHGVGMMGPFAYTQVGKGILKQQQQQPQLLLLLGWRWLHSAASPHVGGDAGARLASQG